jgi:hypothetical protein
MARKLKKFADGGGTDRYNRKVADIESDYAKQQKSGRNVGVAKAKYEQRMADAKDDLAKWTGTDRTKTRADEKAAESNLSMTRRYGSRTSALDALMDKPNKLLESSKTDLGPVGPTPKLKTAPVSFAGAFRAARKDKGAGSTFTWNGKSYSTNMASDKPAAPKPAARSTSSSAPKPAARSTSSSAPSSTPKPATGTSAPATKDVVKAAQNAPKPMYTPSPSDTRAAKLLADAADTRKRAADTKDHSGSAIYARLQNMLGITGSREQVARNMQATAQRARWADVTAQGEKDKTAAADAQRRADRIAAGNKPNATMTEKFYAQNPDAMKKGGAVKKMAKGGSIDGIAQRGKTRCKGAR